MKLPFIPWGRVGLAIGILVTTAMFAAYKVEERRANKLQAQVVKWQRAYAKQEEAGRIRQEQSGRVIVKWRERIVERKSRINKVENAPLPGNCRTPAEVTEAVE